MTARLLFASVVAAAIAFSTGVRLREYDVWRQHPERYTAARRPLVTSMDAFYFLRWADELREGTFRRGDTDPLYGHPDGRTKPSPPPLLSVMLAVAARAFGGSTYTAGIYVIPLLSGLFILPLGLYAWRIGLPGAGLLGGLVGAFGREYYTRTSIGSVDTDALNLFFPLVLSLLILLACTAERVKQVCLFAALAGLTSLLFCTWYFHPAFSLVYLVMLVVGLLVHRKGWKTVAPAALLFVVASNPLYVGNAVTGLKGFATDYVLGGTSKSDAGVRLPSVVATSAEAKRAQPSETLALALSPSWLALAGLVAFGVLAASRWKQVLPLAPVVVLGLFALGGGRRFAMFLGPVVGLGIGFALDMATQRVLARTRPRELVRVAAHIAVALGAFACVYSGTAAGFIPRPSVSSRTVAAFVRLKDVLPRGSVVLTSWDYGYALAALGGFSTYHDGSASSAITSYLIAKGLAATRQEELYGTAACLDALGERRIREKMESSGDPVDVLRSVGRYDGSIDRDDVHVLLTEELIPKYAAIHDVGTWDFQKNEGTVDGYQRLDCSRWSEGRIDCAQATLDVRDGFLDRTRPLKKLVLIVNGKVAQETDFGHDDGLYLQVLADDKGANAFYLLTDRVFRSNFNQLYFLGRYDPSRFEEVFVDFPTVRVYRLRRR